jgi:Tol biopolymer transport system component
LISRKIEDAVQPSWSPQGRRIAFWSIGAGSRDIWTVPATGGEPVRVTQEPSTHWNPVWSPDGKYLYFSSDRGGSLNLWRVRLEEDSGRVLGQAEPVTTPSPEAAYISFARDGRRMAYVNRLETGNIYKIDFDPVRESAVGQPSPVTQGSWRVLYPDVSPNGEWLAFSTYRKPEDLYVARADGTGLRQLTDDEYSDRVPHWSPDGKRIAFHSNRGGGTSQIWTINADGSGLQQLTREHRGTNVVYAVWSPDGSRLAYALQEQRPSAFIMDLGKPWEEGSVEALPPLGQQGSWFEAFSWSPDGRRLAGQRRSAGASQGISVYSFDSRRYEHFTEFGWLPRWLSDGRRLVFCTTFGATSRSAMYLLDTRSRKVREVLSLTPNEIAGVAPSRDDRRIYFGLNLIEADVWLMSLE